MDLTKEQQEKPAACGAILREAGEEMPDETLHAVAGGVRYYEELSKTHRSPYKDDFAPFEDELSNLWPDPPQSITAETREKKR